MATSNTDAVLPPQQRSFSVERKSDESGVSGTGIVLEGCVFSTGYTVIHWLQPFPRGSVAVFDSFDQFMRVHVLSHPTNNAIIHWADGDVWMPEDYPPHPAAFDRLNID